MFNNRMLAVAAVLVMAVPALGAATPIVVPPVPEQLVEGHTVFTVIEIVSGITTATNETRFAAAVAVLVREYSQDARVNAQRFPGVLWFNDQYLVNPSQEAANAASRSFRYPCGGAVMAVNAGDPDPRMVLARIGTPTIQADLPEAVNTGSGDVSAADIDEPGGEVATFGDDSYTYGSEYNKPFPGTYYYGQDGNATNDPDAATDYAWIGTGGNGTVNATNASASGRLLWSDTVVGATAGSDYVESYLITDPNDHSWIIDKYQFYTRDAVFGGLQGEIYSFPVWVVNVLGSPVFVPDGLPQASNCSPYKDLVENIEETLDATLAANAPCVDANETDAEPCTGYSAGTIPDKDGVGCGRAGTGGLPPYTDDPCMSYQEPSRNGYCYGGQTAFDVDGDADVDRDDCENREQFPLRLYNALLYFRLEDLRVAGANRDHSDPVAGDDTNGCAQEQYPWGPNPPLAADDWPCPNGDDNAEGNSHPFHPNTPTHLEAEDCFDEFYGTNPTNHGGSTYVTPDTPNEDGWYAVTAPCDYLHATRNIDVYYSGGGRPFAPVVRSWGELDLGGSSAPFQDFHNAYPNTP